MEVEFTSSFTRDLRRLRNAALRARVEHIIEEMERAPEIAAVAGAARLKGVGQHYRIRVGEYRIGLSMEGDTAVVTRFLHRRDIYRHFP